MLVFSEDIPGPALLSSLSDTSTASGNPQANQFASFGSPLGSQSITPQPPQQAQSAFSPPGSDPFAAFGASFSPPSRSPAPPAAPTAPPQALAANNDDDDWNFSSALPPTAPAKPKEHRATVSDTTLRIELYASRKPATGNAISLGFAFSNNAASPISELHFQLAVTKVSTSFCLVC
jgi:ADP-ribosylation factor-binding protein GGA